MGIHHYGYSMYQIGGCIGSHHTYYSPDNEQIRVVYRGEVGGWLVFSPITEMQKEIRLSFEEAESLCLPRLGAITAVLR